MGLFDRFPYSNIQELNLDWLLSEMMKLNKIYEDLQKEIQDTIDFVNNFEKHADELIDERIKISLSLYEQKLKTLEIEVQKIWDEINKDDGVFGMIQDLQEQIDTIKLSITNLQHTIESELFEIRDTLHKYKYSMEKYVDGKVSYLENYIVEKVTKIDRLDVVNPINGLFQNIQQVIDEMYSIISKTYGITAEQYDSLQLTAREYDAQRITAYDYDTKGYFILYFKVQTGTVISPFTGIIDSYQNVINNLANLHKCALTAQEYDNRLITAEEYDNMKITAWVYDWFGFNAVQKITAGFYDNLKLTAKEYDDKNITAGDYDRSAVALLDTTLKSCKNMCGDYVILGNQITLMSSEIDDLKKELESYKPIKHTAGCGFVGQLNVGETETFITIPSLKENDIVMISSNRFAIPIEIDAQPSRGVKLAFDSSVTENEPLSFNVNVQNKI